MHVRSPQHIFAFDIDPLVAQRFANELGSELEVQVEAVKDLHSALRQSDICITCTPSKKFFVTEADIKPGTFIAAVGSDSEEKQEIDPVLLAKNKVISDSVDQCATIGELHHAIHQKLMTRKDVHAELGDVILNPDKGRKDENEIIIFDSTGTALQDVAASAIVYERALKENMGIRVTFA
jgi:ornithine cyclodeaminase/alanine dehydrogenase